MSDEYLKTTRERSLEDDSKTSESELHASNESIREGWQLIQDIKNKISGDKKIAIKKVNDQYQSELAAAMSNYALLISLTR